MLVLSEHFRPAVINESAIASLKSWPTRADDETLGDFIHKSAPPASEADALLPIEPRFSLSVPYITWTAEESGSDWLKFRKARPGVKGLILVSRVGFSVEQSRALTCVGHWAGPRLGHASYFLLEWRRGAWKIKGSAGAWRS